MRQDGIRVRPIRQMTGTAEFCEVFFDGARAPEENVVGKVFVLLWPSDHFTFLHRPDTFADVPDAS